MMYRGNYSTHILRLPGKRHLHGDKWVIAMLTQRKLANYLVDREAHSNFTVKGTIQVFRPISPCYFKLEVIRIMSWCRHLTTAELKRAGSGAARHIKCILIFLMSDRFI